MAKKKVTAPQAPTPAPTAANADVAGKPASGKKKITVPRVDVAPIDSEVSHFGYTILSGKETFEVEQSSNLDLPIVQALAAKRKEIPWTWSLDAESGLITIVMQSGKKLRFFRL